LAAALAMVVLVTRGIDTSLDTGTLRDAEPIATALSGLRPGDRVFAPIPSNGPLAYYFVRAGLDTSYLSVVPRDSARVFVVVNTAEGFVLKSSLRDPLLQKFTKARLMARYPSADVYRVY